MKIGIFGGSFNPVHIAHLIIAESIREEFKLDKIIFVPAGKHPLKSDSEIISSEHRLKMLFLAIEGNPFFEVSDYEIKKNTVSYTVETLKFFYKNYAPLYLIVGNDWLKEFNKWYRYQKIFDYAYLIVLKRVDFHGIPDFLQEFKNKILFANNPIIEISSTLIRERLKKNQSIRYLVPPQVYDYIIKNNLYKNNVS